MGLFDNFVNITVTSKHNTFCKRDEEEMTEIKAGAGSCLPYKMIKIGRLCGLGRGQASLFFILLCLVLWCLERYPAKRLNSPSAAVLPSQQEAELFLTAVYDFANSFDIGIFL